MGALTIRMDGELRERLSVEAKRIGNEIGIPITISEVARKLIEQGLEIEERRTKIKRGEKP